MGIEIPGAVEWLVPIVVGADWPEGDETALRRLCEAWTQAATAVGEVVQEGNSASTAALGCMTGATAEAFDAYWKQFVEGDAYLVNLQQLCTDLASGCDDAALNIEYTKLSIIAALIILAAQIVAMIASAVATFGSSTAGIPIAQAATKLTVQMFFRELIKQIAVNVAINVGINVGVDVLIQGGQMVLGDREKWDVDKTVDAGIAGVMSGVAAGGVGAASKFIPTSSSNFVQAAGRGAAEGAVSGALGNVFTNVAHGKFDVEENLKAAMAGGISGSVGGAVGGMSTRHEGLAGTWVPGETPGTTAGPNTQGHTFTTADGATVRANVDGNPYNSGWNSGSAKHIPGEGGPNNVNDARDDDYEVKTSANPPRMVGNLDLPDPPKP